MGNELAGRIGWSAAAMGAVVVVALLVSGWRPVVLLTDSMAPHAPAGSLLLARPVAPGAVEVGDVVTLPRADAGRLTHRVLALEELEGGTWARLRGDANQTLDPGRVALPDPTLRTVAVVPGLGRLLGAGTPLAVAGLGLLLVGLAGLGLVTRSAEDGGSVTRDTVFSTRTVVNSRLVALLATVEVLADEGLDARHLTALAWVRVGPLIGLDPIEDAPEAAALDDGARFVLVALVDADPAALALVPPSDSRAGAAHAAVDEWWARQADRVPVGVRSQLADVLPAAAREGGIVLAGPVD